MRRTTLSLVAALIAATGGPLVAAAIAATPAAAAAGPCGTVIAAPTYTHVVWILMENHSFSDIIGNTSQPIATQPIPANTPSAITHRPTTRPSPGAPASTSLSPSWPAT